MSVVKKNKLIPSNQRIWMLLTIILLGYIFVTQVYEIDISFKRKGDDKTSSQQNSNNSAQGDISDSLQYNVIPEDGIELPIIWGELGKEMTEAGVIDEKSFRQVFNNKLSDEQDKILTGKWNKPIRMTTENSRFILNMLWALGLSNKNSILTEGEMANEEYGGAENFASTGGWTLAKGEAMDHYSQYEFIILTPEQQKLVEKVSQGIYRPCCGNSVHFPDCNHGMAMLGLLELMASQGVSEKQMYKTALSVNSIWFPQTYLDLAVYFREQGQDWKDVDPKLALSQEYSSGQGYQATRSKIKSLPQPQSGGGGCGV
jgi:hypothetical protein